MDKRKVLDDEFVQQRGNPGAFVNRDIDGLLAYKEARQKRMLEASEINNLKEEIDSIKSDISSIKDLLTKALENK
jgi:hypothetical protein